MEDMLHLGHLITGLSRQLLFSTTLSSFTGPQDALMAIGRRDPLVAWEHRRWLVTMLQILQLHRPVHGCGCSSGKMNGRPCQVLYQDPGEFAT
jgi:hypothetical protein